METSGENVPDPIETFEVEMLGEDLMRTTTLCGYTKPTPVQKYSIPIGISNRDLMACAQTGSGKTAGFLFPTLISLLRRGGPQVCMCVFYWLLLFRCVPHVSLRLCLADCGIGECCRVVFLLYFLTKYINLLASLYEDLE